MQSDNFPKLIISGKDGFQQEAKEDSREHQHPPRPGREERQVLPRT